ncbi:hypothetical protein AGMMS49965_03370 [Bacteroidia bacterium]|nr:hypothetical protein AGMMS49965_03370 [Bacteroidia bacterium]
MEKKRNKGERIGLKLLIFIFGMTTAFAQKSVSINNEKIFQEQGSNPRSRAFEVNPQLQNFSQNNVGDRLLLDFFDNKQYEAVVLQVSKSYDGIVGITAQVANTQFGYCYISVAGNNIALSAELPQKDEFFSVKKINGKYYLTAQTLSEVQHEHGDECSHVSESGGSMLRAVSTPTLPESSAAATVDILVVYTPVAKAEAITNGSTIDLDIAAGIQRSNQVLSNSNTNVTLNVVYKQEVNYTESGSTNTDLDRLKEPGDGYADEVHALRTQYDADLVVLLLGDNSSNVAGAGYILGNEYGSPRNGFSAMKAKHTNTTGYVLIHEIGHNFGCGHHVNTDLTALYSYSHGHGGTSSSGGFSTIMTYDNLGFGPRIPYFSDPAIMYNSVAVGTAGTNNAKTIRQSKGLIAGYSDEAPFYDAFLKDITLSSGALSPAFNPGVYQYTVNVSNSVTSIDVEGIANSPKGATITGNVTAMPLSVGSNTVTISVEDAWGTNWNNLKTYTVTVNRSSAALSNNANLNNLTVNQGTLTPTFNANTISYSVSVANTVSSITISATKAHAAASVSGDGAKTLNVGANAFTVDVTAEDGTTKKTYTVNITRAAPVVQSNDATLSSLTVNQGTLTPTFNASTTTYSVSVANSVASITISATANHGAASVAGTGSQSLNVGSNSFNIVCTAEDGTPKTYTVNITRAAPVVQSNDATLSSLSVNQGTLTPTFNANTTSYSVSVANSVASITISATANHDAASVAGVGNQSLSVGNNSFNIVCTAEDGTPKTYTVNITRAAPVVQSNDATLSSLSVNQGTLTPTFSASTTSYSVNVANSVASITISATANHDAASVAGVGSQSLSVGNNPFNIVCTAEDGTPKTYTVTVTRAAPTLSNNANLSRLTVDRGTLSPNFAPGTKTYTVNVENSVTSITLTAWTAHIGATVWGEGTMSLSVGANVFPVVVVAEDGTTKTYTVTVNRASPTLSSDATLRSLSVSQGTLTPTFNANITTYSVSVAGSVSSITISAIANQSCCKCVGTGTKSLRVGNNSFDIECTAEDGTMKTYTVMVARAPLSNDANLSSLTVNWGRLTPNFNSATTAYTVSVGNSTTSIKLTATAVHDVASVAGDGAKSLNVGTNTFSVVVTAEDGTTKVYTLTVNREASATAIESPEENSAIKVWSANGMLHIDSPSDEITLVRVYDVNGRLIQTVKPQANQFETANPHGLRIAIIVIETSQNRKYSKKMVLL